jgi:hypothetical protein
VQIKPQQGRGRGHGAAIHVIDEHHRRQHQDQRTARRAQRIKGLGRR